MILGISRLKSIRLHRVTLLLLIFYAYFSSMSKYLFGTNSSILAIFIISGCLLLLEYIFWQSGEAIWFNKVQIGWLIIYLICVITNRDLVYGSYSKFMYFTTLVALVILLPNHSNWFSTAINWMCFFTYIHAIATCLLYLFPELYRYILPMLNESVFLDGYKSGLTIHYSTNGIYLGIGCVICWCRIMHSSPKRASRIILGIIVAIALFLTTKRAHVLFGVLAILIVYMCGNKRGLTRWMKLLFIMVVGAITFLLLSRIMLNCVML